MEKKINHRIRNWSEHNKALAQRGNITLWFSEESIKGWRENKSAGKKSRLRIYSANAFLCALMIRAIYHLPLRTLRGFLLSLITCSF
ncbi:transposase [Neochlamydia sp. EPS4]|uniref:transposase n=1 Tax=Neochlamydia sp. EPS4 TaxID=1478175 RepID=UPI0006941795